MKILPVALLLAAIIPSLTLLASRPTSLTTSTLAPTTAPFVDRSISVSGDAELTVVPDIARFTLLIEEDDADKARALAEADDDLGRVLKVLAAHGISGVDIVTQAPTFTPKYALDRHGAPLYTRLLGWEVSRSVVVCSHKLDDIGALQRDAFAAGARPHGDITFDTSKLAELRIEVRKMAAKAARAKAVALVDELGGSLGLPRTIHEDNNSWNPPSYKNVVNERGELDDEAAAAAATDFSAGRMSLTSTVNVTFDVNG